MILTIAALNIFLNFCYGAMIVVLPQLNLESAGLAYSFFFFFRAAWYFVSGNVDDKLGPVKGITLSLLIQAVALYCIFNFTSIPWLGRILEGIALAQGTVSSLTAMRLVTGDSSKFSSAMGLVLGLGSIGFVAGPVSAFFVPREDLNKFGSVLVVISIFAALLWLAIFAKDFKSRTVAISEIKIKSSGTSSKIFLLWPVLALACIKSVVLGLQLNLGWWAKETMGLSSSMAGMSFVVLSVLFAAGALLTRYIAPVFMAAVGLIGYLLLEIALKNQSALWWVSLVVLGIWYGFSISKFYAKLGWNDSDQIGTQNATWLFLVDAPIAIVPVLIWPTRAEIFSTERMVLVIAMILLSSLAYLRTFGWGVRAPMQNSRS